MRLQPEPGIDVIITGIVAFPPNVKDMDRVPTTISRQSFKWHRANSTRADLGPNRERQPAC
ncbi:MAG: hypothetical protein ACYDDO_06195 [Acidiferrobacterales bacterium]